LHKTLGTRNMLVGTYIKNAEAPDWEKDARFNVLLTDRAGIVKSYEAVTEYCG